MQGDISGIIFKARQTMDENSWNALPSTTNAQEAKHTDYYHVAKRNQSVHESIKSCYLYALNASAGIELMKRGVKIRYGSIPTKLQIKEEQTDQQICGDKPKPDTSASIAITFNTKPVESKKQIDMQQHTSRKKIKRPPTVQRKANVVADWRAPDTNETLLGKLSPCKVRIPRPKAIDSQSYVGTSQKVYQPQLSEESMENDARSAIELLKKVVEVESHLSANLNNKQGTTKRKRGHPIGSKNKIYITKSTFNFPLCEWKENSCWIDCIVETFLAIWPRILLSNTSIPFGTNITKNLE
jgi:hypothetical protein